MPHALHARGLIRRVPMFEVNATTREIVGGCACAEIAGDHVPARISKNSARPAGRADGLLDRVEGAEPDGRGCPRNRRRKPGFGSEMKE